MCFSVFIMEYFSSICNLQYMLRLPRDATVEILKKAVSELTGVHHRDVRVVVLISTRCSVSTHSKNFNCNLCLMKLGLSSYESQKTSLGFFSF